MKIASIKFLILTIGLISSISCNQIKDEKRVVIKSESDDLLFIKIPAAACGKCQKVIEEGLANEEGVKQSILNLNSKEVSIVYDAQIISPEILRATVTELSYKMPCK